MSLFSWNKSRKSKSWSAPRGRRGRNAVKPNTEGLEERVVMSVSAQVVNHTLVVTNNGTDTITLDHSGSDTLVNGDGLNQAFADSSIYNGISLNIGGLSTLNIKANRLPINVEGNNAVATVNLGNSLHGVQDIDAVVHLHHLALSAYPPFGVFAPQNAFQLNVDDSADQNSRNVTMNVANKVGTITGLAPATITYDYEINGAGNLDIWGGQAGDFFDVVNTFNEIPPNPAFLGIFPELGTSGIGPGTTIHGNKLGGELTVDVQGVVSYSSLNIDAPGSSVAYVNVSNGGTLNGIDGFIQLTGRTSVAVNDSADPHRHFQLSGDSNGGSISLVDPQNTYPTHPTITFDQNAFYVGLWGGPNGNTVDVLGTSPKASTEIYPSSWGSQANNNSVNVDGTTGPLYIEGDGGSLGVILGYSTNSVQGILGSVTVADYGGLANLSVWNYADPNGHTVQLNSANGVGTISGLTPNSSTISYTNAQTGYVGIGFGGGTNAVNVNSIDVQTSLYGGNSGNFDVFVGLATETLDGIHAELDVMRGSGKNFLGIYDSNSYYYNFTYSYDANPPANTWGGFHRTGGNHPVNIYYLNMGSPYVGEGWGK
jgi:hypothetical protein